MRLKFLGRVAVVPTTEQLCFAHTTNSVGAEAQCHGHVTLHNHRRSAHSARRGSETPPNAA